MAKAEAGGSDVILQRRDMALLRDLAELRAMALEHCAEFHFNGRAEAARIRIRALANAGLVRLGREKTGSRTLVFSAPPARAAPERKNPVVEPSHSTARTLAHTLQILDVRAAFHRSARSGGVFTVAELGTSSHLYQFPSARGQERVLPDGFVRLRPRAFGQSESELSFFVELDRSTETVDTLMDKAREYFAFYQSGGFARRNGSPGHRYRRHPFRLLVVLKSEERRNNLAAALLRLTRPILTFTWLATFEDVRRDPTAAIWLTPAAYREAVRGTRFADSPTGKRYRTDPARERLVEERAEMRRLLP